MLFTAEWRSKGCVTKSNEIKLLLQSNPSRSGLSVDIALLIIVLTLIIIGIAVYWESVNYTIDNINNLQKTTHKFGDG